MSTRALILAALREAPEGISGEEIGLGLDISRAAVSKHVTALRAMGYVISGEAGRGYRLVSAPDALTPLEVGSYLDDPAFQLHGGGVTVSTNDDARALARLGAPEYTVALASGQTGGRGRLGRTWSSPEGGVYLSIVLRPTVSPAKIPSLSLVVGLAVVRALATFGIPATLKWPNDVRVATGKVAGISLEMSAEIDRVERVVVGLGINVARGEHSEKTAGYLSDIAKEPAPRLAQVAAAVLAEIKSAYEVWRSEGFAPFVEEFSRFHDILGDEVVVRSGDGETLAAGTVAGVDSDGRLVLSSHGAEVAVASGEVTLRVQ